MNPKGYLECYCKINPFAKYEEKFPLSGNGYLCKTWILQKIMITLLSFMSALIIVVININIKTIFTGLIYYFLKELIIFYSFK